MVDEWWNREDMFSAVQLDLDFMIESMSHIERESVQSLVEDLKQLYDIFPAGKADANQLEMKASLEKSHKLIILERAGPCWACTPSKYPIGGSGSETLLKWMGVMKECVEHLMEKEKCTQYKTFFARFAERHLGYPEQMVLRHT